MYSIITTLNLAIPFDLAYGTIDVNGVRSGFVMMERNMTFLIKNPVLISKYFNNFINS